MNVTPNPLVGNHRPRVDGFSSGIIGNRVKRQGLEHEYQCHIYERRIDRENGNHRRRRETENALKVLSNHIVFGSEDIEDVGCRDGFLVGLYGMVLLDGLRVTGEPWECPPVWVWN